VLNGLIVGLYVFAAYCEVNGLDELRLSQKAYPEQILD
jgi:hypothetical protein